MLKRIIFSIKEAFKNRHSLKSLPFERSILAIDWQALYQSGIRVIVLDFDGVLAEDNALRIRDELFPVLNRVRDVFGERIYILSNKPKEERQAFFALNFTYIHFILAKKKPYPEGLLEIIRRENVAPQEVMLIDDRLLTGGLAAILAKTRCVIIEKPYMCFAKNWFREFFFLSLRVVERLLFQ